MANKFVAGLSAKKKNTNQAYTNNGALTNATSGSAVLDFFFIAGASRGKDITKQFDKAYAENPDLATRIVAWLRDRDGGAGERQTYRNMIRHIEVNYPELVAAYVEKTPELGRWDDLLEFRTKEAQNIAWSKIGEALHSKDNYRLVAKWMPRQGKIAAQLREFFGLSPKQWRKYLVARSQTVEQLMCSGKWDEINFEHVPSTAFARYKNAFRKHVPQKFETLVKKVEAGEAKIKAGALYPYDVIRSLNYSRDSVAERAAEAQWKALPDYIKEGANFLAIPDVSGSMSSVATGSVTAMDVSKGLAIYVSERCKGAFKDVVLPFAGDAKISVLKGTLKEKLRHLDLIGADWGSNTNFQAAFDAILKHAIANKVPAEDMPTHLLVLSDMEFDATYNRDSNSTNYDAAKQKFLDAGYTLPNIVFWNLNARAGNNPVQIHDERTALVSGFSPSIMGSVLGKNISPMQVVIDTVGKDKYKILDAA